MKHTEMIAVIQAHSEGKTIEYDENLIWKVAGNPLWNFSRRNYRVKPVPVYKVTTLDTGREVFKYVSINAFEDAMAIIESMNADPDRMAASFAEYNALKELL